MTRTRWQQEIGVAGHLVLMVALSVGVFGVRTLTAQSADRKLPEFEVVSIKLSKGGCCGFVVSAGRSRFIGYSVKDLIKQAYGFENLSADRVYGEPAWTGSTHFDVEAKAPDPLPADWQKIPSAQRTQEMIQSMLANRFKLKIHHETRETAIYVLTVSKNGPKMKPTTHALTAADLKDPPANGMIRSMSQNWGGTRNLGQGNVVGKREDMTMFTEYFLQYLPEIGGRSVIDKTGLAGAYDFTLQYLPDGLSWKVGNSA